MTDNEVNKIIAEFMGYKEVITPVGLHWDTGNGHTNTLFTESLDALVPVWEKLKTNHTFMVNGSFVRNNFSLFVEGRAIAACQNMKTLQQSAAHGTAKAILELKSE